MDFFTIYLIIVAPIVILMVILSWKHDREWTKKYIFVFGNKILLFVVFIFLAVSLLGIYDEFRQYFPDSEPNPSYLVIVFYFLTSLITGKFPFVYMSFARSWGLVIEGVKGIFITSSTLLILLYAYYAHFGWRLDTNAIYFAPLALIYAYIIYKLAMYMCTATDQYLKFHKK